MVVIHGVFASLHAANDRGSDIMNGVSFTVKRIREKYRLRRICTSHFMGWDQGRCLSRSDTPPPPISPIFTHEGDMDYTGCGNTEHRGPRSRALHWLPTCPDFAWEKVPRWACFALWWKFKKACHTQGLSKNVPVQATINYSAFFLYILWCLSPMPSHVRTLCRTQHTSVSLSSTDSSRNYSYHSSDF